MRVESSVDIAVPQEKVWPFLIEPEKILKWIITFQKFEYTTEQYSGVALPPITIPPFRSKLHSLSPLEREAGNRASYEV